MEARVVVATNNDHLRLLLPSPLVGQATKVYTDPEVGIVMESITLKTAFSKSDWQGDQPLHNILQILWLGACPFDTISRAPT
jgi:hypothetical protein